MSEAIELVLVGDVYVQRPDPDATFVHVGSYLKAADVTFGNLETVVADPEHLDQGGHGPRTDEWMIRAYVNAGFDIMNLANNPSMYRGVKGLLRTMAVLNKAGIAYGGGGKNLEEARGAVVIERKGVKLAFVCRTSVCTIDAAAGRQRPGLAVVRVATAYEAPPPLPKEVPGSPPIIHTIPNTEDVEALRADITDARQRADVIIVSWHWGISPFSGGKGELARYQTEMAQCAIDAGADLVVGHHPHLVQPIEVYKGKTVFYSLANFVHDGPSFWGKKQDTILVRCRIRNRRIAEVSFVPGFINEQNQPVLVKPAEAPQLLRHIRENSAPFGTDFEIRDEEVAVRTGDKISVQLGA
jgi:poly-gamma-glutamate capsule biosynthesis protein CapA/YwtB (metallophosphatase superfamily)